MDLPARTGLSMGQWLCVPMVLAGIAMWLWAHNRQDTKTA